MVIVFSGLSYYEYCFVIAAFNKVPTYLAIPLTFSCFVRLLPVQGLKLVTVFILNPFWSLFLLTLCSYLAFVRTEYRSLAWIELNLYRTTISLASVSI